MRNLPYRGPANLLLRPRGLNYTPRHPVQSTLPQVVYSRDVTGEVEVEGGLLVIALEDGNGTAILIAAAQEGGATESVIRFRGRTQSVNLVADKVTLIRWDNKEKG